MLLTALVGKTKTMGHYQLQVARLTGLDRQPREAPPALDLQKAV
jgi:hypothetical protein